MPTPRIPSGFKPVVAGYNIGAPDGVFMTEVGGGLPRVGMEWDRGKQQLPVTIICASELKFQVWSVFFHKVIAGGAIQFLMPLKTGGALLDHLCTMIPGTYSAVPVSGAKAWSVSFSVFAESSVHDMSDADVTSTLDLWEVYGDDLGPLFSRLDQFVIDDMDVLSV